MAKLYAKKPRSNKNLEGIKPKQETIDFILNYSKALKIVTYKKEKFETILN
ncbi:hypothetical protein [Mesonia sp. K7]|uniref:hypothetical protein n=1 Tax=Mesonia sp. K7 TaxID=2218606 RepID=UPI0018F11546|nr:hypothetical protein [Mesonia sp. K7]